MKKTISILSLILSLFACVTLFSACGGDDDKDASPSTNPLVGTWYIEIESHNGYKYYTELTYNADNTCTWWRYRYEGDNKKLIDSKIGTYKIDGNQLSILYNGEKEPWTTTFTISGDKMITTEGPGYTWTKK